MDFVEAAANLRAEVFGIPKNKDRKSIAKMLDSIKIEEFTPRSGETLHWKPKNVFILNWCDLNRC